MIKDHCRDYATAAFQFYAKMGKPTYRSLKAQLMADALEQYHKVKTDCKGSEVSKPTEAAVLYAEAETEKKEAELLDILAVEKVCELLNHEERKAVELVYFQVTSRDFKKGEISNLVCSASLEIPASERTVYYYLSKARKMFGIERGLRT